MKILVGKTFGLGNAVMAIPMLKALSTVCDQLDVLVGSMPDDGGALEVMSAVQSFGIIDVIWVNSAPRDFLYDIAIMSIPYDQRWKNSVHYNARSVLDGRTRPDPTTVGLVSWEKNEVEYQMENAYTLGYSGEIPSTEFYGAACGHSKDVYLGVGYKKDVNGFWSQKHWGNANFAEFVSLFLHEFKDSTVLATGDMLDWNMSLKQIQMKVSNNRFVPDITKLTPAFDAVKKCGVYVGNDTGMMHVAASMGIPCVSPFFLDNSITKSAPWPPEKHYVLDGTIDTVTPEEVFYVVRSILNASKI